MPRMRPGDQPLPVPNDQPDMWLKVIQDMGARRQVGIERYNTVLQPLNGRDTLRDAYEEGLDLVVYLRTEVAERDLLNAALARVAVQLGMARTALRRLAEEVHPTTETGREFARQALAEVAALDAPEARP